MGIVPRGPDYGSTHEFPYNQCLGSLDFEHSDRLPVHEESLEEGGNISAGLYDTDSAETSGMETSSLREKVKAMAWIVPVVYTHFWIAAVISLLPPFFPPLASSRGVPAWKYGFVFSAVKLSMLPGSVLGEKLISKVSPRAGYLGGQASFSLFSILFGTLYWIKDGNALLAAAISCIAFGGCMYTTYTICLYCLLSNRFQEDGCLLIGLMECLWGIGTVVGAIMGGALIDLWAFPLPFYVTGVLLILSFPAMAVIDPKSSKPRAEPVAVMQRDEININMEKKYYKLIFDPMFLVNLFSVMVGWAITSFCEPTLEPYLRQFKFTSTQVGSVFMIQNLGYSVGAILGGVVSKYKMEKFFIFLGLLLSTMAFLILGPAPFVPIKPNPFFIYLAQVFMGLGMAFLFICPYMHALRDVVERAGYPDNLKTNGVVTSATYQFMVFGAVITSPLAGYLVQKYGFRQGSMFLFWILAFWTVVTFLVWLQPEHSSFRRTQGDDKLLINNSESSNP